MGQLLSNNLLVVFCPLKIVVGREPIGFDGAAVSNLALDPSSAFLTNTIS